MNLQQLLNMWRKHIQTLTLSALALVWEQTSSWNILEKNQKIKTSLYVHSVHAKDTILRGKIKFMLFNGVFDA